MYAARLLRLGVCTVGVGVAPSFAHAHFVLNAPASWQVQNGLGDPQKAGPCGDPGTKTKAVTTFHAGETVHFDVDEMVPHGGHYRVALGLKGVADLPLDPKVVTKAGVSVSAPIENPPQFPVLADGVNLHTGDEIAPGKKWTWDVKLPAGMTCSGCILQVTEFMTDHGSNTGGNDGYFYHHCANVTILPALRPDAGLAADAAQSPDAADGPIESRPDAAARDAPIDGASGAGGFSGAGGGASGSGGSSGDDGQGTSGSGGAGGAPDAKRDSGGCALAGGGPGGSALLLLLLLALARRR